ncbi:MAG: phosphotransferase [Planctomycetes bacterium]|nr:phosphotransferase [Planctomycetota bacterium]
MSDLASVAGVLSHYPGVAAQSVESLGGAGGFSGAAFWKVSCGDSTLCLRRWPKEHPSRTQLQWLHEVICRVSANGFAKVPTPIQSRGGQTFVSLEGQYWELTAWLPGTADFREHPTSNRLDAALVALAQFHQSAESIESVAGAAPGIATRREQLDRLCLGEAEEMSRAVAAMDWAEFQSRAATIMYWFDELSAETKPILELASRSRFRLQPCIRDVWHDHVLFEGEEVSGIVDFGAMRVDHVACDVARLLGSLVGGDRTNWKQGLAAYQSLRPLSLDELALVDAYDRSTVLLSGMNWVQWVAVELRKFENHEVILARLDEIIARLAEM